MRFSTSIAAVFGLASLAQAHFILNIPTSLGFNDENEGIAPCGGFDPTDRTNVSNFKIKGSAVGLVTTHDHSQWEYKFALVSNLNNWISLTPPLHQEGLGEFCEPQIPGKKSWIGRKVVLQVIQHGHDGDLYQCAAIKFVWGGPAVTPPGCVNATGITAAWE